MRISLLHPFRVDMTIIEIVDKANYLFFLKENARERERERKKERESTDSFSKSTDSFMFRQKETCRKFRNYRNDHNYLSYCQAAITVEDSMVNNKTN